MDFLKGDKDLSRKLYLTVWGAIVALLLHNFSIVGYSWWWWSKQQEHKRNWVIRHEKSSKQKFKKACHRTLSPSKSAKVCSSWGHLMLWEILWLFCCCQTPCPCDIYSIRTRLLVILESSSASEWVAQRLKQSPLKKLVGLLLLQKKTIIIKASFLAFIWSRSDRQWLN